MTNPLKAAEQESWQHYQEAMNLGGPEGQWTRVSQDPDIIRHLVRAQLEATLAVHAELRAIRITLAGG